MSTSPSRSSHDHISSRLRAAGCVYAEDEADLLLAEAHTPAELEALVVRRASGVPLEQVLGWAELCGVRVSLVPGVFVPRRRTALLAREALSLVPTAIDRPVVLDLCCGSGAVGAVVVAELPHVELHAVDVDPAAVSCARGNLPDRAIHLGDLYDPLPERLRGSVHVVVANAPYVPTSELRLLPRDVREHEPAVALDGGHDGLEVQRRVVLGAREWLADGGHVLVETSIDQAAGSIEAMSGAGLTARLVSSPDDGATVVVGRLG
jgi:release factor glutamine methyltransferase